LENSEKIRKEFALQPRALELLFGSITSGRFFRKLILFLSLLSGVIVDLYLSKYKFKGKKAPTTKETELRKQLMNYNLQNLKAFFANST
jgi:hypothetical protein